MQTHLKFLSVCFAGGENFVALDLIVQHVHSQLEKVTIAQSSLSDVSDTILLIQLKTRCILITSVFTDYKYRFSLWFSVRNKCSAACSADKEHPHLFSLFCSYCCCQQRIFKRTITAHALQCVLLKIWSFIYSLT